MNLVSGGRDPRRSQDLGEAPDQVDPPHPGSHGSPMRSPFAAFFAVSNRLPPSAGDSFPLFESPATSAAPPSGADVCCGAASGTDSARTRKSRSGMKAVVWRGRQKIAVEDVPPPQIQESTDAIIRVTSTGICGSDLHLYGPLWPVMKSGDIIGHEAMGIVESVGSGVVRSAPATGWSSRSTSHAAHVRRVCATLLPVPKKRPQTFSSKLNTLGRGKGASIYGYTHMFTGPSQGVKRNTSRARRPTSGRSRCPNRVLMSATYCFPTFAHRLAGSGVRGSSPGSSVAVFGLGPIGHMAARIALKTRRFQGHRRRSRSGASGIGAEMGCGDSGRDYHAQAAPDDHRDDRRRGR